MTVVDINQVRAARAIANEFSERFGNDIKRARSSGYKLMYRLQNEEQIGRGTLHVVEVQLVPVSDRAKRKLRRLEVAAVQGRADYVDPPDLFEAMRDAIDVAFEFANDQGVL